MNNTKFGIFWLPPKEVEEFINGFKKKVSLHEPDAPYLTHPVHSTIFLFYAEFDKEKDIINSLEEICIITKPFIVSLSKWIVFENDNLTGRDTFSIGIELSNQLSSLQFEIANKMEKFISNKINYPNINWTGEFELSYSKWGFPFVGEHWIPHLSVASVKNQGREIMFQCQNVDLNFTPLKFDNVAIFRIEGDKHIMVKKIKLNYAY